MSLFGLNLNDSLSNLKGQISNITKEVLSDGSEYPDSDTHVVVPSQQIKDYESSIELHKLEIEKLRRVRGDLEERLQVAELNESQNSAKLMHKLTHTENELRAIKQRCSEWGWEPENLAKETEVSLFEGVGQQLPPFGYGKVVDTKGENWNLPGNLPEFPGGRSDIAEADAQPEVWQTQAQTIENLRKEINSVKEECSFLRIERDQLYQSLQELDAQHQLNIEQLLNKKSDLQSEISHYKSLQAELQNELSEHKSSLGRAQTELSASHTEYSKLKSELSNNRTFCEALQTNISEVRAKQNQESVNQTECMNNLSEQLSQLTLERDSLMSESSYSSARIAEQKQHINTLQHQLDSAQKQIQQLIQNNHQLEQQHSALSELHRIQEEELAQHRVLITESKSTTQKLLDSKRKLENDLEKEASHNAKAIKGLQEILSSSEEEVLKLEAVVEARDNEHKEDTQRLEAEEAKHMRSLEVLVNEGKETEDRIKELKRENEQLMLQLRQQEEQEHQQQQLQQQEHQQQQPQQQEQQPDNECIICNKNDFILKELIASSKVETSEDLLSSWQEQEAELARLRCDRDKLRAELQEVLQEQEESRREKDELENTCEDLRDQLEEIQWGNRQQPEGEATPPRTLPTIEEEGEGEVGGIVPHSISPHLNECKDTKETSDQSDRIRQLSNEVAALSEARRNLEMEILSLNREKESLRVTAVKATEARSHMANLQMEVNSFKTQNESLRSKLRYLESTRDSALAESESKSSQLKLELSKLQNSKKESQEKVEDLENLLEDRDPAHTVEFDEFEKLKASANALNENIDATQNINDNLKIESLQVELDKARGLVIYKDDQIDQYKHGLQQIGEVFGIGDFELRNIYVHLRQTYEAWQAKNIQTEVTIKEINQRNTQLELQSSELQERLKSIAENEAAAGELEKQLQEAKREAEKLAGELQELNEDRKCQQIEQILDLESKLEHEIGERNRLVALLQEKNLKINSLEDEGQALKEKHRQDLKEFEEKGSIAQENFLKEVKKKNEEIERLILQVERLQEERNKQDDSFTCSQLQVNNEIAEIKNAMKQELEILQAKANDQEKNFENEKKNLLQKIVDLETAAESAENVYGQQQQTVLQQLTALQQERQQLITTSTQKHHESLAYYQQIQKLTTLLEEEQNKCIKEVETKDILKSECDKIMEEKRSLSEDYGRLTKERASLTQEIESLTQDNESLTHKYESLTGEHKSITHKVESVASENESSMKRISVLTQQLEQANREFSKMSVVNKSLTQQKNILTHENEAMSKENDILAETIALLRSQIEALKQAASASVEESKEVGLKNQLGTAEVQLQQMRVECDRLRVRLLQVEEQIDHEVQGAESREASLRETIAKLHNKMAHHNTHFTNENQKTSAQMDSLQSTLEEAIQRRDEAMQKEHKAETAAIQQKESLQTLQTVLQDFQKSQSRDITMATERERRRVEEVEKEKERLKDKMRELELSLQERDNRLQRAIAETKKLESLQNTIICLKDEAAYHQETAKNSQDKLAFIQTSSETKVDKPLLRNLLVGYFATPSDKQTEVLRVIAQVLDFSPEERRRTGLDVQASTWMSSIANFLAPPPSNIRVTNKVDLLDHSSLSQAFIRFLEDESSPRQRARLPAVQMAQETDLKVGKKVAQMKGESKGNLIVGGASVDAALAPFDPSSPIPISPLYPITKQISPPLQPVPSTPSSPTHSLINQQITSPIPHLPLSSPSSSPLYSHSFPSNSTSQPKLLNSLLNPNAVEDQTESQ